MKLSSSDLFLLCQCAISAAYQAGHLISKQSGRQLTSHRKNSGSSLASQVVTEVDFQSQAIILNTLRPTCDTFNLALLSEEAPDDRGRLDKDYFWCVDPLDGTLSFIQSTAGYSVSIALVARDGEPVIGVIYDPLEQTLYHAVKGCGAYRNGRLWNLDTITAGSALTFITDRSFVKHRLYSRVLSELKSVATHAGFNKVNTFQHGGAAMNACWVLENNPACYFKFPKPDEGGGSLWDFAATAAIFQEAGAVTSDIFGQPLDLNRDGSTFMNHRGVLYAANQQIASYIIDLYTNLMSQKMDNNESNDNS